MNADIGREVWGRLLDVLDTPTPSEAAEALADIEGPIRTYDHPAPQVEVVDQ